MSAEIGKVASTSAVVVSVVALVVVFGWSMCGRSGSTRDVERAATYYLDRVYPGDHGLPSCTIVHWEGSWATCDVAVRGAMQRLHCTQDFGGQITCRAEAP